MASEPAGEGIIVGKQGEVDLEDPVELVEAAGDVDELLPGHRDVEEREPFHIAGADRVHVAERVVAHDDEVGVLDMRQQRRVRADADLADIAG